MVRVNFECYKNNTKNEQEYYNFQNSIFYTKLRIKNFDINLYNKTLTKLAYLLGFTKKALGYFFFKSSKFFSASILVLKLPTQTLYIGVKKTTEPSAFL